MSSGLSLLSGYDLGDRQCAFYVDLVTVPESMVGHVLPPDLAFTSDSGGASRKKLRGS